MSTLCPRHRTKVSTVGSPRVNTPQDEPHGSPEGSSLPVRAHFFLAVNELYPGR